MSYKTGSCPCGAVTITVPLSACMFNIVCHCVACRKQSGTVNGVHIVGFKLEDFDIKGDMVSRGPSMCERFKCSKCYAPIYNKVASKGFGGTFPVNFIKEGERDESVFGPPLMHIWYSVRGCDLIADPGVPIFSVFPLGFDWLPHSDQRMTYTGEMIA